MQEVSAIYTHTHTKFAIKTEIYFKKDKEKRKITCKLSIKSSQAKSVKKKSFCDEVDYNDFDLINLNLHSVLTNLFSFLI